MTMEIPLNPKGAFPTAEAVSLQAYASFVGPDVIAQLYEMAEPLKTKLFF